MLPADDLRRFFAGPHLDDQNPETLLLFEVFASIAEFEHKLTQVERVLGSPD